jgi:hypothetical protein
VLLRLVVSSCVDDGLIAFRLAYLGAGALVRSNRLGLVQWLSTVTLSASSDIRTGFRCRCTLSSIGAVQRIGDLRSGLIPQSLGSAPTVRVHAVAARSAQLRR